MEKLDASDDNIPHTSGLKQTLKPMVIANWLAF